MQQVCRSEVKEYVAGWRPAKGSDPMQNAIETVMSYQGITLDERMALSHFFDKKEEELVADEMYSDAEFEKEQTS